MYREGPPKTRNSTNKSVLNQASSTGALTEVSKQRKVCSPNKSRDSKALTSAKHVSGSEESKVDKKGGKIKSPEEKVKKKKIELMMTDG